mmetsp:Transcript_32698/g.89502  ORF Transcript_32698/g.89502 Transcript_32698/m.89502 type:complete len:97 (-) Transcript_32698:101-391(-)|eukprot:7390296-Prymnesium_polylepis.1
MTAERFAQGWLQNTSKVFFVEPPPWSSGHAQSLHMQESFNNSGCFERSDAAAYAAALTNGSGVPQLTEAASHRRGRMPRTKAQAKPNFANAETKHK